MRRNIILCVSIVLIFILIPVLFSDKKEITQTVNEAEKIETKNKQIIKLYHHQTGEVEEVYIEDYLCNVIAAEMPANFEVEALKAQAIVARTYTMHKVKQGSKHENADICDEASCCQAWISKEDRYAKWEDGTEEQNWLKIRNAVAETEGKVITYNGEYINAFFHANSGGTTENVINVWGGTGYPYLQAVETSGEETYTQYSSTAVLSRQDFISKIIVYHPDFVIDFEKEDCIQILEHTEAGRVKTIKIGNLQLGGAEVRNIFGLKSANFTIIKDAENITFNVIGSGHGVGMSQTGADSLAKQGKTCEEIIKHYYKGVEIEEI